MPPDAAVADSDHKSDAPVPKAVEAPEAAGTTGAAPAGAAAGKEDPAKAAGVGGSLGERAVQAKADGGGGGGTTVGAADDPAEKAADDAADKVMRMPEPGADAPASAAAPASDRATAAPAAGASAPGAEAPVQRKEEPAAPSPERMPAPTPGAPASDGAGGGAKPDTATPAGPSGGATKSPAPAAPAPAAGPEVPTPGGSAPVVGPTAGPAAEAPGDKAGAETGTPAPAEEPPAPEGEAPARETPQVSKELQEYLDASRGKGAPLPEKARKSFESKYQRPFDDVRIHDNASADDAAKKIDAVAFTRGNDIYFRSGAFDPEGPEGKKLLAHELAHVVQQRPGVNRQIRRKAATSPGLGGAVIRRETPKGGKADEAEKKDKVDVPAKGTIDISNKNKKTLTFSEPLKVPDFKKGFKPATIKWRGGASEARSGKQRGLWLSDPDNKAAVVTSVKARIATLGLSKGPYELQGKATKKQSNYLYTGEAEDIASALVIPPWAKGGVWAEWEVDHKAEWQIGGEDEKVDNFWLLNPSVNSKSGNFVKDSVKKQIEALLTEANKTLTKKQTFDQLRGKAWSVTWSDIAGGGGTSPTDAQKWDRADLKTPEFMEGLEKLEDGRLKDLKGSEDKISIYPQRGGGRMIPVPMKDGKGTYSGSSIGGSQLKTITWNTPGKPSTGTGPVGMVTGDVFKDGKAVKKLKDKLQVPIIGMPGVDWGGVLDKEAVKAQRKTLIEATFASPIEFDDLDFDLDKGLAGRGRIPTPSLKLLEKASIFVITENGEVGMEAVITGDELQLPGPFKIQGGALVLKVTTAGLGVEGRIDFEIEKLAKGFVKASAGTSSSFSLEGELNFETKMFTKAQLGLSYKDGKWGVTGELEVGPNKIKGIKKASAKVTVADETVTASGEFEPSIKGIEKGTVGFKYNEATGMEITGEIVLGKGIPGIQSGKLSATIKEGKEGYSLSGAVTVVPSVPGLSGSITGKYEDGAFLVEAELGYERGIAAGKVMIGVTNQAVGEDGKPSGPPMPDGALIAYGGGSVTLTMTPWLKGTIGLKLKPNGEVEVSGEIALPSTFDVFDEKKVEKKLLSIGIDIPIVGVAVAGQRIGIFATIKGSVGIQAGFGPGQLKDVALKVTYNPDHPDDTTVTGTGSFVIPASAGMRLQVDGGLGAGIPIVSATAGISVFGEIGLAGAAKASAKIDWSPKKGIVLDAEGDVTVQPKFKFGVDAFVDVSADLVLTTVELYHEKWNLASFEYGSDLEFGVTFPIHYESGKPFAPSFDDMKWKYPDIDPGEVLGGLMKQLVG